MTYRLPLAIAATIALSACSDGTSTVEVSEDGTVVEVRQQAANDLFMDAGDIPLERDQRRDTPPEPDDFERVKLLYFDQTDFAQFHYTICVENFYGPQAARYEERRRAEEAKPRWKPLDVWGTSEGTYDENFELCEAYINKVSDCLAERGVNLSPLALKSAYGFAVAMDNDDPLVDGRRAGEIGTVGYSLRKRDVEGCLY